MNLDLSKWNPFKFHRKSSESKRAESSTPLAAAGSAPTGWADGAWPLMTDPLRMMQEMMRDPFAGLGPLDRWFGDYSPSAFQPRVDVVDDGDALRIAAELPGMERKDLEVLVEDDAVVLRGEKKLESRSEEKGCYRVERAFGSFQRVVPLPEGVDVGRAEAKFDKGVLTLRLPKSAGEQSAARRLEIR
jgi:HSP20 family protein